MPNKFIPVIIASVIIIVVSSIPLLQMVNIFCCSGVIAGGFFGTMYYANRLKQAGMNLQFKDSAAIGVLSGIISAIVVTIISTLIQIALHQNPIPEMFNLLDSQGISLPPQIESVFQNISEEYSKNGFSKTIVIFTLISDIISYPIFSTAGALIATAIYSRRRNDSINKP